jgi:hypothetical protein
MVYRCGVTLGREACTVRAMESLQLGVPVIQCRGSVSGGDAGFAAAHGARIEDRNLMALLDKLLSDEKAGDARTNNADITLMVSCESSRVDEALLCPS